MITQTGYIPLMEIEKRIIMARAKWEKVAAVFVGVKNLKADRLLHYLMRLELPEALVLAAIYNVPMNVYKQINGVQVTPYQVVMILAQNCYKMSYPKPTIYHGDKWTSDSLMYPDEMRPGFDDLVNRCVNWKIAVNYALTVLKSWCSLYDTKLANGLEDSLTYAHNYLRVLCTLAHNDGRLKTLMGIDLKPIATLDVKAGKPDFRDSYDEEKINEMLADPSIVQRDISSVATYFRGIDRYRYCYSISLIPDNVEVIAATQDSITIGTTHYNRIVDDGWYKTDLGSIISQVMTAKNIEENLQHDISTQSVRTTLSVGDGSAFDVIGLDNTKGTGQALVYEDWRPRVVDGKIKFYHQFNNFENINELREVEYGNALYCLYKAEQQGRTIRTFQVRTTVVSPFAVVELGSMNTVGFEGTIKKVNDTNVKLSFVYKSGSDAYEAQLTVPLARIIRRYVEVLYVPSNVGNVATTAMYMWEHTLENHPLFIYIMKELTGVNIGDMQRNAKLINFQIMLQIMKFLGMSTPNKESIIKLILLMGAFDANQEKAVTEKVRI